MKRLFCLLVLLFSIQSIFAQVYFIEGYVISNTGDTLKGKLRHMTPAMRTIKAIFVNEKGDGNKERFKPFQIKGFLLDELFYESKIYSSDPGAKKGYGVFMERKNTGTVRIYEYWNTDKERGFTQTFLEDETGVLYEVDYFRFKKKMSQYFSDCNEIKTKILNGVYKKRDLAIIVEDYNKWIAENN